MDLRPASPTYLQWAEVVLDSAKHNAVFAPRGIAHGCLSLSDNVVGTFSDNYYFNSMYGIRWDDPLLDVGWRAGDCPQLFRMPILGFLCFQIFERE